MATNLSDVNDYYPYAQANTDFGLCVDGAANGIGLVTRGLVWQGWDIWCNIQLTAGISTAWTPISGYSGLATPWTVASGGVWGEYTP